MNLTSPAVETALKRFESHIPRERMLSLGRLEAVLETLGNPERKLPPVIHVAGTNGKGSTAAFMRAMAEAAGLTVHVSTSPHLVRFNERIRLAGKLVEDAPLLNWIERVHEAVQGREITHFEACQAVAFLAFCEVEADLLILEVGLGGRFDASNVIETCEVAVITPVDFDHMQFLGNSLDGIARDKAGILKPGRPGIIAMQALPADAAIREVAAEVGAPLEFLTPDRIAALPGTPSLRGEHQKANAALAAMALRAWRVDRFSDDVIRAGVEGAVWPARMQHLSPGPVTERAGGVPVWLDGGHNPHAARAISGLLDDLDAEDRTRRTVLITAMLDNKDPDGFFAELKRPGMAVYTVPIEANENTASPQVLAEAAARAGLKSVSCDSLSAAVDAARRDGAERLLICGSLYLAGQVLAMNDELPD